MKTEEPVMYVDVTGAYKRPRIETATTKTARAGVWERAEEASSVSPIGVWLLLPLEPVVGDDASPEGGAGADGVSGV
jgi:hypothetical protein